MNSKLLVALAFAFMLVGVVSLTFNTKASPAPCAPASGAQGANALYAQLSSLDKVSRKQFYQGKTPEQKKALWLVHLHGYNLDRKLTLEQERLITELTLVVKNGDFSKEGSMPLIAWMQAHQAQFFAQFSKAEMLELLKTWAGLRPSPNKLTKSRAQQRLPLTVCMR